MMLAHPAETTVHRGSAIEKQVAKHRKCRDSEFHVNNNNNNRFEDLMLEN